MKSLKYDIIWYCSTIVRISKRGKKKEVKVLFVIRNKIPDLRDFYCTSAHMVMYMFEFNLYLNFALNEMLFRIEDWIIPINVFDSCKCESHKFLSKSVNFSLKKRKEVKKKMGKSEAFSHSEVWKWIAWLMHYKRITFEVYSLQVAANLCNKFGWNVEYEWRWECESHSQSIVYRKCQFHGNIAW